MVLSSDVQSVRGGVSRRDLPERVQVEGDGGVFSSVGSTLFSRRCVSKGPSLRPIVVSGVPGSGKVPSQTLFSKLLTFYLGGLISFLRTRGRFYLSSFPSYKTIFLYFFCLSLCSCVCFSSRKSIVVKFVTDETRQSGKGKVFLSYFSSAFTPLSSFLFSLSLTMCLFYDMNVELRYTNYNNYNNL